MLFPSERVVKVVVFKKKEMVLSTTFALAQRHERRGILNMTISSRWDVLFPSERVVKVVVLKKKEMVLSTTFALAQRHEREEK